MRMRHRTLIPQRPDAQHHNLTVIYGRRGHPPQLPPVIDLETHTEESDKIKS